LRLPQEPDVDVRQLNYALAVARAKSFTRAAERLNVSQSTISEQVALLEARIGFPLFRRTGRGVEPTETGRLFLDEAERVAGDLMSLVDLARRLKGLGTENVRLGIGSGLAPLFLPKMFAEVSLAQSLNVEVKTAPTRVVFDELQAERLDLGIVAEVTPDRVPAGLAVTRLVETEMVAIAPPKLALPLAARKLDLARLGDIPVIMNELSVGYGQMVAALFSDLGVRPRIRAVADNVETMKVMVAAGFGIALIPAGAAEIEVAAGRLRAVPVFPACPLVVTAYRARHASRRKQALIERLLARCTADGATAA
jgi:DNA-binding transcriptional LysR family regulator